MGTTEYLPQYTPKNQAREFPSAAEGGEDSSAVFHPQSKEVLPNLNSCNTGASNAERQLAPLTSQGYTLPEIDSTRTIALTQTFEELRRLRDEILTEDPSSPAGLALGQLSLILARLAHNIHSGRADFVSLIRACERTP